MKIVFNLLIFLGALYFLACIVLYFIQESILFYPEALPDNYIFSFTTSFEEINLHPDEKTTINAIWFKHPSPKGVIVYFHGNAGSLETWGAEGEYLTRQKYDVVMVDYRGYGKSRGSLSEKNLFADAQYLYNYIKKRYSEENIIVFGRSIGTGIATFIAAQNSPRKLILESPYYSMEDVAKHKFPWFPVQVILRYPLRTYTYLQKVKCPVCIFHGTQDEVVPYQSGWKLKNIPGKKEDRFVTIQGGHHNDLGRFYEYEKALNLFLL